MNVKGNLCGLRSEPLSTKNQLKGDSSLASIPNSLQLKKSEPGLRKKKKKKNLYFNLKF